jgi:hypothetical protein
MTFVYVPFEVKYSGFHLIGSLWDRDKLILITANELNID